MLTSTEATMYDKIRKLAFPEVRQRAYARSRKWNAANKNLVRDRKKEYRLNNHEKELARCRASHLKSKYGITTEEYDKLLHSQGGVCFICGYSPTNYRLAVDHCHVKGFSKMKPEEKKKHVRGLLCHVCNRFRMAGKPSVEIFQRCIEYLERHGKQ